MSSVAFIGLGVMGTPMARHLAAAGHQVTVYNRTPEKSLAWVALYGNLAAPTPREAADGAEFVFMCVGNDNDVRDVVYGPDGVLAGAEAGAVLVDHTTASAEVAARVGRSRRRVRGRLRRRSGVGWSGRRRERATDDHVRQRRRSVLRAGQAGDGGVRQGLLADGHGRSRAADQDGQPDLHRRHRAGPCRGDQLRGEGRPRPGCRSSM